MTHNATRNRTQSESKPGLDQLDQIYEKTWQETYRKYRSLHWDRGDAADAATDAAAWEREKAYKRWYKETQGKDYCPREF